MKRNDKLHTNGKMYIDDMQTYLGYAGYHSPGKIFKAKNGKVGTIFIEEIHQKKL